MSFIVQHISTQQLLRIRTLNEHKQALTEYLREQRYNIGVTLTFNQSISRYKADKKLNYWTCAVNKALFGTRWYKHSDGIQWVAFIEKEESNLHYHLLIKADNVLAFLKVARVLWIKEVNSGTFDFVCNTYDWARYIVKEKNFLDNMLLSGMNK